MHPSAPHQRGGAARLQHRGPGTRDPPRELRGDGEVHLSADDRARCPEALGDDVRCRLSGGRDRRDSMVGMECPRPRALRGGPRARGEPPASTATPTSPLGRWRPQHASEAALGDDLWPPARWPVSRLTPSEHGTDGTRRRHLLVSVVPPILRPAPKGDPPSCRSRGDVWLWSRILGHCVRTPGRARARG